MPSLSCSPPAIVGQAVLPGRATILVIAAIFVLSNVLVDVLQAVIAPRIRR